MKYLTLVFLIVSSASYAQYKTETISEKKIGSLSASYSKFINVETKDTGVYMYFSFQNLEYSTITDIKSIQFVLTKDSNSIIEFLVDLKLAYNEIGKKTDMTWIKKNYKIYVFPQYKVLYLYNEKGVSGYTKLNQKQTLQLINWIESNLGMTLTVKPED